MSGDLEEVYRAYIDALNGRRLDDLDQFVHALVVYNDRTISRQQYAEMIAEDVRRIPDLHFTVDLLVTGDDVVACRLWFDCTPEHEFAGIAPTGRRVTFAEHVFYRFRDGRIERVWSLIDTDAVRDQARNDH
ncbi:ester cyclase [Pseudonocardia humida]|uniref:Ester cyclase n=1 Tax=Pseudonocardia humida TaxID=2800819 RepID=A0ABT1AA25_9PSEU|nr:ester cyclase [Pseudonocardia humida]MCO1659890.1 ester cyclase [Pseudonocardia humida]